MLYFILTLITEGWFLVFMAALFMLSIVAFFVFKAVELSNYRTANRIIEKPVINDHRITLESRLYRFIIENEPNVTDVFISPAVRGRILSMIEEGGGDFIIRVTKGIQTSNLLLNVNSNGVFNYVVDELEEKPVDNTKIIDLYLNRLWQMNKIAYNSGEGFFVFEEVADVDPSELAEAICNAGYHAEPVGDDVKVVVDEVMAIDFDF